MRDIVAILTLLLMLCTATAAELEPIIAVYAGGMPEFAEMLASVIESDDRASGKVMVLQTPGEAILAAALPTTECIVVYANHKDYVLELESALVPFFEEGGGIVGVWEVCYEPSAQSLATKVFPVFGNSSRTELSPRERRTRTYVLEEGGEVASAMPESFQILSMGTYLSADEDGNYVRVPGEYRVVYRDNATGCPLVITHESSEGGRSVAFPGIMLASIPRLDVYYGNLVVDENFVKLFTNSVFWAADNGRINRVQERLTEAIEEYDAHLQSLKEEADKARKEGANRRVLLLSCLWIAGLASSGVVVRKVMLSRGE